MSHIDVRDLGRVRSIVGVLTKHGFGSILEKVGLSVYADEDREEEGSDVPLGVRLRHVLVELGPTFVKLGQVLSVRPDILPPGLIKEFQKLQDDVPPVSWEIAREALEAELGGPISSAFAELDSESVASASIAQVHLGVLKDGTAVAVKIQRPGIHATIRSDLHILFSMARLTEGRLMLPGVYTPVAIVQEFEAAIMQELDFTQEARNAARFRECFQNDPRVCVPDIYREWTSPRLLVMDRIDGTPLSQLEEGDGRLAPTLHHLVDATIRQIFDHGFFHGDPHPGNLLLTDDGRLAFLDFGICGTLTAGMRETIATALVALVFQDAETLALTIYRSGGIDGRVDLKAFRNDIERLMVKYQGASLKDLSTQATLVELVQCAARHRIRLVPEYALLARAASLVDGTLRDRLPNADPVELVRPHAKRLMAERLSPDRIAADGLRMLVQAQGDFKHLPTQLNQLLMDLERGQLRVRTHDEQAAELHAELRTAAFRLSLAVSATGMLLAGSMLFAAWSPTPFGIPLAGIFGAVIFSLSVGMWLWLVSLTVFGRQLSLRTWRRRATALFRFFVGDRA